VVEDGAPVRIRDLDPLGFEGDAEGLRRDVAPIAAHGRAFAGGREKRNEACRTPPFPGQPDLSGVVRPGIYKEWRGETPFETSIASRGDIERFVADVWREFGDRLDRVVIYGSYAREEHVPGSDIDVAILVTEKREDDRKRAFDVARTFILDEGLRFSPRVFEVTEFERKADEGNGFYRNVRNEGIEV
jgi:predicted nucleotidyltransferase